MNRILAFSRPVGLILSALALSGCLMIQDVRRVDDPRPYFDRAYDEIQRLENGNPHRRNRAHELCLLVHEDRKDELVRVVIPLWLVKASIHLGGERAEHESEFGRIEDRYEFDWGVLSAVEEIGPGLLVDVTDANDKILVWLR